MSTFAERLKQLREQAGLTQASLAQASGLSLGIIRDYEQGKKEPALRSAFKLAEVLGISVEVFKATDRADELSPGQHKPRTRRTRKPRG
jgi:transcriptional regulator with XRE-family HTH domain